MPHINVRPGSHRIAPGIRLHVHDDGWEESKHHRGEGGRFGSGTGAHATPSQPSGQAEHFKTGGKPPPSLNGVSFQSFKPPEDWNGVDGQAKITEPPMDAKGKKVSAGLILSEPDGRVWIVKPTNAYGGYQYTFPKGGVDKGDGLQATAIKETWEESGLKGRITKFAGDYEGTTSVTRYYHAVREGGTPTDHGWESEGVSLIPRSELPKYLNMSRDQKIAKEQLSGPVHDDWNEEAHQRGPGGQFGPGTGKLKDKHGKEYDIEHRIDSSGRHEYNVMDPAGNGHGGHVAGATLRKDKPAISATLTRPEYQRRGIATQLYNHIERHQGTKLQPNAALTEEGKAFWKARQAKSHDDLPFPLDPDLLALARGKPSNMVQQIYLLQAERSRSRVPFRFYVHDDGEWNESKVHRSKGGQFASTGGGGGGKAKPPAAKPKIPDPDDILEEPELLPSPGGGAEHGMLATTVNKNLHASATAHGFKPTNVPLQYENPTTGAKITGKPGGYWIGTMPGKKDVTGKSGASLKAFLEGGRKALSALVAGKKMPPHTTAGSEPTIQVGSLIHDVIKQHHLTPNTDYQQPGYHVFDGPDGSTVLVSHKMDENGKVKWSYTDTYGKTATGAGAMNLSDHLGKPVTAKTVTTIPAQTVDPPMKKSLTMHEWQPIAKAYFGVLQNSGFKQSPFDSHKYFNNETGEVIQLDPKTGGYQLKNSLGSVLKTGNSPEEMSASGPASSEHEEKLKSLIAKHNLTDTGDGNSDYHELQTPGGLDIEIAKEPNDEGEIEWSVGYEHDQVEAGAGLTNLSKAIHTIEPPGDPGPEVNTEFEAKHKRDALGHFVEGLGGHPSGKVTVGGEEVYEYGWPSNAKSNAMVVHVKADGSGWSLWRAGEGTIDFGEDLDQLKESIKQFAPHLSPGGATATAAGPVKSTLTGTPGEHPNADINSILEGIGATHQSNDTGLSGDVLIYEIPNTGGKTISIMKNADATVLGYISGGGTSPLWSNGPKELINNLGLVGVHVGPATITKPAEPAVTTPKPTKLEGEYQHPNPDINEMLQDAAAVGTGIDGNFIKYQLPGGAVIQILNNWDNPTFKVKLTEGGQTVFGKGPDQLFKHIKEAAAASAAAGPTATTAPAKPLPPVPPPAIGGLVNTSGWTKVSGNLGSNPGGVYMDEAAKRHYIKETASESHAKNENLAAALYNLALVPTLTYHEDPLKPNLVITDWNDATIGINKMSPQQRGEVYRQFATHAWLANWDAVGLADDNMGVINATGKVTPMDVGGALLYRAQGGPKGSAFGNEVTEWESMREGSMNPQAVGVFSKASPELIIEGARAVAAVTNSQIIAAVAANGPGTDDEKLELAKRIIARRDSVIVKANALATEKGLPADVAKPGAAPPAAAVTPPPPVEPVKPKAPPKIHASYNTWTPEYKSRLKKAPIPTQAEANAVQLYSGYSHAEWNDKLRTSFGKSASGYPDKELRAYLAKASWAEEGAVVTRKIDGEFAEHLIDEASEDVHTFQDFGFASSDRWSGRLTLKITLPKGAQAAAIGYYSDNPSENEILIQAGSKYRIDRFDSKNLIAHVTLIRSGPAKTGVWHEKLKDIIQPSPQPMAA